MRVVISVITLAALVSATGQTIAQTYNLKAGEKLSAVPCEAWRQGADGSWTLTGQVVYPGNVAVASPTVKNTSESRELDAKCAKK
jgi:hypothetical protein